MSKKLSARAKEHLIGLTIAMVGSFGMTYFACDSCAEDLPRYLRYSIFSMLIWAALWIGNAELNDFLSRKISWIKQPIKRLLVGVFATVVYSVGSVILIIKCWELIWSIRFNSYAEIVLSSLVITTFISLFFHGRAFLMQWKQAAVEAERYQKESIAATYENLKSQLNPHFLFNSLNALTNLVYEDQDKAAKFIKQLSQVYRYVLDTREKELVSLEEELRFVKSYLYLQEIRFGANLKIDLQLQSTTGSVAPLALQLLLENAIKHNIISRDEPLTIKIYEQDGFVCVENNIQRKSNPIEHNSRMGLENIRLRYSFLTSRGVEVIESERNFLVKIPLVEAER